MSTFTLDQEQQLHRIIYSVSPGIAGNDEEQVFAGISIVTHNTYTSGTDLNLSVDNIINIML